MVVILPVTCGYFVNGEKLINSNCSSFKLRKLQGPASGLSSDYSRALGPGMTSLTGYFAKCARPLKEAYSYIWLERKSKLSYCAAGGIFARRSFVSAAEPLTRGAKP